MTKLRAYEGGCHCERVRFRVTADLSTVTICNCSICTKKGIVHLIVPQEQFELLCGKDDLTTYTFNTGVALAVYCMAKVIPVTIMKTRTMPASDPKFQR